VDRAVVAAAISILIQAAKPHLFSTVRGAADPPSRRRAKRLQFRGV